ncbi:MAG: hypothetical protein AAF357_04080 [Verrucomicrobiota bacterium]
MNKSSLGHAALMLFIWFDLVALRSEELFSDRPRQVSEAEWMELKSISQQSRYMESGLGELVAVEGWKDFPTKRFTYRKCGRDFTVITLSPTPDMSAWWIYSAVTQKAESYRHSTAVEFANFIRRSSGFQFPVRGFVVEQMDSHHRAFIFFDGISAALKSQPGITNFRLDDGVDDSKSMWHSLEEQATSGAPTPDQVELALQASQDDVDIFRKRARISGLCVSEFGLHGSWIEHIGTFRDSYKDAWHSRRNKLINATYENGSAWLEVSR